MPLYYKFTIISKNWLNDCKDIKLLVPTHVVSVLLVP